MRVGAAVAEVEVEDTVCSGKILAAVLAGLMCSGNGERGLCQSWDQVWCGRDEGK